MLILNPLETEVSNPEKGDSQESSNASWAGRKANCLKNLFSLCPPWWSSQQGWQVFLLGFWEVGICQPPLKSRSTIYFVCHWSKAAGFKSVSWKWVFLIPSYPDSLISWKSHLPVILKTRVSNVWADLLFLQALYIAVILVLSAV